MESLQELQIVEINYEQPKVDQLDESTKEFIQGRIKACQRMVRDGLLTKTMAELHIAEKIAFFQGDGNRFQVRHQDGFIFTDGYLSSRPHYVCTLDKIEFLVIRYFDYFYGQGIDEIEPIQNSPVSIINLFQGIQPKGFKRHAPSMGELKEYFGCHHFHAVARHLVTSHATTIQGGWDILMPAYDSCGKEWNPTLRQKLCGSNTQEELSLTAWPFRPEPIKRSVEKFVGAEDGHYYKLKTNTRFVRKALRRALVK